MIKAEPTTETVERIIRNHFSCSADEIRKMESATNNTVYSFTAAGESFFLKLYRNKDWPEAGKIWRRSRDLNTIYNSFPIRNQWF